MHLSQEEIERRDGEALKLRLKYEMGLITREQMQQHAAQWDEDKRNDMRERFREAVESVESIAQ